MVAREIILAKMAVQEPKKLDASPPLCFLAPCVKPVTVDGKRLDRLMAGLHVFGLVVPSCAVAKLWITLEAQNQYILYVSKIVLLLVENVAMSYTLYCLFQLYVSTHDILHHYKPTDKFVAIKAILGIAVLQSMIIKVVCGKFLSKNSYFTVEMMADFWSNFALCCESIILAIGHKKAYPSVELEDTNGAHAARQKAARAHAMEMLALPPADGHGGGKGHDNHVDAEGGHANGGAHAAPSTAAAVIDVDHSGAAALEQWTPDMDAEHWPASPGTATTQPPPPIPTGRPNMYGGGTGSARIPAFPQ
jgi:Organic solute transporter Ostalpha